MSWKFKQIKPQKARGKFHESLWFDPNWRAENKFDGDRRIAQFCDGRVRFTGTRESVDGTGRFVEKSLNLPHLDGMEFSRKLHTKLDGTVLDGEIVAPWAKNLPGGESKYVTAVMGSLPKRAIELQKKHGWLEYMVFDCLWFCGDDVREETFDIRLHWLSEALDRWDNTYALPVHAYSKESEKRRAWKDAKEGLVFKHIDHMYGNERLWAKLKKEATTDVVIMGFEGGKGKYTGSVGAIIFGQIIPEPCDHARQSCKDIGCMGSGLVKFGTCRGFTDEQMNQFFLKPKKYIGRVIEILHNGREPTGAFRHPRFKRFRDDKSAKDCVYDPEET